jgi:Protein of unknown function with HXXEE motif
MKRTHEFTLWVVVMVLGLHFLEEFALDLRTWLQGVLQVPVTWEQCHLVNGAVTLTAIGGAVIGWRKPELSLIMPAIVIINAFFFHLGFSIISRSYSPGTLSALMLFVPAGLWCYVGAHRDGVLTRRAVYVSVAGAVFVHLWLLSFHLIGPP